MEAEKGTFPDFPAPAICGERSPQFTELAFRKMRRIDNLRILSSRHSSAVNQH